MSIGSINSKNVKTENRQEQENCSLDIYCIVVFTPYSLCEAQLDLISRSENLGNATELQTTSYAGDIHCQRVIYSNYSERTGDAIEDSPIIVVECSDTASQLCLSVDMVISKISYAHRTLQNLLYKYIGHRATFHIGVIGFTLTEDIAKCFAYNICPNDSLLPEEYGLSVQIRNRLKFQLYIPYYSRINLDYVINYDTFPVIFSKNPNLLEELDKEIFDNIGEEYPFNNNLNVQTRTPPDQGNEEDAYGTEYNEELSTAYLLKGGVSHYEYVENQDNYFEENTRDYYDILRNTLRLLNPAAAVSISTFESFVNYIQTDEGKIWWDGVSQRTHLIADAVRDSANKVTEVTFNFALGGYAVAGAMALGSGGSLSIPAGVVATGSTLILFGSGVAATISSIASMVDIFTYIFDYISDPIENDTAPDTALNMGVNEVKSYIIRRIAGNIGKRIQCRIPQPKRPTTSYTVQLRRQRALLDQDNIYLRKNQQELLELNKKNPKKSKVRTKKKELLQKKRNLQKKYNKRQEKINGLYPNVILEQIENQSSSTLDDIFSNFAGGALNKIDLDSSEE